MDKNDNKYEIKRGTLWAGIVSLIKVGDETEKLNIPEALKNKSGATVLIENPKSTITAINIRKIVFNSKITERTVCGEDILYKLNRKEKYQYPIFNEDSDVDKLKNNSIVITDAIPLCDVLEFVGMPRDIQNSDLGEIRKTILSNGEFLNLRRQSVALGPNGIVILEKVDKINDQAKALYQFQQYYDLPTKPQEIEKVYAKYFK